MRYVDAEPATFPRRCSSVVGDQSLGLFRGEVSQVRQSATVSALTGPVSHKGH
jgi:hypothetical protein